MKIKCRFTEFFFIHGETFYGCEIENHQIPEDRELKFIGKHLNGKTNYDVQDIKFKDCNITKVPQGLQRIFPNLKVLDINNSKLKKISKNDLIEYKYLKILVFNDNDLEYLPGDLFDYFEFLTHIEFDRNKLSVIEPNILDNLHKLTNVSFASNPNYNNWYSIHQIYEPNATIQEIKDDLRDKYFSRFKFLQDLKDSADELEDYKETFKLLENQIQALQTRYVDQKSNNASDLCMEIEKLRITLAKHIK